MHVFADAPVNVDNADGSATHAQWLNYSEEVVNPYKHEAWRAEARARMAESRGEVPDRRPGVFAHSRHSFGFHGI